jgi:hypothetical protein
MGLTTTPRRRAGARLSARRREKQDVAERRCPYNGRFSLNKGKCEALHWGNPRHSVPPVFRSRPYSQFNALAGLAKRNIRRTQKIPTEPAMSPFTWDVPCGPAFAAAVPCESSYCLAECVFCPGRTLRRPFFRLCRRLAQCVFSQTDLPGEHTCSRRAVAQ